MNHSSTTSSSHPIIGLTGGIGSGKSTAGEHFKTLGITVVDVDHVAREIVQPGQPALNEIIKQFGKEILLDNGHLDRAQLRRIIFSKKEARQWLEQLTHPMIMKRTMESLKNNSQPYSLLVSPLLFESKQHQLTQYNIVVDLPEALQLSRAASRDKNTPEEIQKIMAQQLQRKDRTERADFILLNDKDIETLKKSVIQLHHIICTRLQSRK